MAQRKSKIIPVPPKLQASWAERCASGSLSPFEAHVIPGAESAIIRSMDVAKDESETVTAYFNKDADGNLTIEVLWTVDAEFMKKMKAKKK